MNLSNSQHPVATHQLTPLLSVKVQDSPAAPERRTFQAIKQACVQAGQHKEGNVGLVRDHLKEALQDLVDYSFYGLNAPTITFDQLMTSYNEKVKEFNYRSYEALIRALLDDDSDPSRQESSGKGPTPAAAAGGGSSMAGAQGLPKQPRKPLRPKKPVYWLKGEVDDEYVPPDDDDYYPSDDDDYVCPDQGGHTQPQKQHGRDAATAAAEGGDSGAGSGDPVGLQAGALMAVSALQTETVRETIFKMNVMAMMRDLMRESSAAEGRLAQPRGHCPFWQKRLAVPPGNGAGGGMAGAGGIAGCGAVAAAAAAGGSSSVAGAQGVPQQPQKPLRPKRKPFSLKGVLDDCVPPDDNDYHQSHEVGDYVSPAGQHAQPQKQHKGKPLKVLQQHVVLPVITGGSPHLPDLPPELAASLPRLSREAALDVALAASKSGLLGHLCWHLEALSRQLVTVASGAQHKLGVQSHAQGLMPIPAAPSAGPSTGTAGHSAGSSQTNQQAATQHLLAKLLLVYQWTAALCRIWPSSVPDAAPLRLLLMNTVDVAAQLVKQLPHLQLASPAHSAASEAHGAASIAGSSSAVGKPQEQSGQLMGPVTAAVLEVSALVLEPLGWLLLQQQEASRTRSQPPSLSASAKALCDVLLGSTVLPLQALLMVCLHQLVLHADRKREGFTHQCADSNLQRGAACSTARDSSNSASRSIAELAGSYLLQHADTLQVKQPAAPNRAAVLAWRGVCEGQWAAGSFPLTLQAAATVLASAQPSVATASSSRVVENAGTAAAAVWAMQDCGDLDGRFKEMPPLGQGSSSAGVSNPVGSSASKSSNSSSCFGSAGSAQCLPAAQDSDPILSITSCTHKVKALSAVCLHLAEVAAPPIPTGSSSCSVACTLLAAAAAAASLEGAAALPLVSAAVAAANVLVKAFGKQQAQQAVAAGSGQQDLSTQASGSPVPGSKAQPPTVVATTAKAAAAAAAVVQIAPAEPALERVSDEWLLCLSLAADLTRSVLQLEGQQAVRSDRPTSLFCAKLLSVLLARLDAQADDPDTDAATQLRQLQTAAHTLQLVEAAVRRHATSVKAEPAACEASGLKQPTPGAPTGSFETGRQCSIGAARSALQLLAGAGESVLGSLQGQQLLQSCTSLLLTCSTMLYRGDHTPSPSDLALCVQLLQLLQRSEAQAAGGSSCGMCMSQSLAAGLSLAGRFLMAPGTILSVTVDRPDLKKCRNSAQTRNSAQRINQHQAWLLLSGMFAPPEVSDGSLKSLVCSHSQGILDSGRSAPICREQASILQQAMQDLADCVHSIHLTLQQQATVVGLTAPAAPAVSTGAAATGQVASSGCTTPNQASSSVCSSGGVSSSTQCCSSSSSSLESGCGPNTAGGTAQVAATATVADWQLDAVNTAQAALQALLKPLGVVLAPYLQEVDPCRSKRYTSCVLSLPPMVNAAGEALCAAVPSSACCSNPRCTNLSGVSAGFALVRGKGCVCGGCLGLQAGVQALPAAAAFQGASMAARYCSRECQAAHRQQHKDMCCMLAQAALPSAGKAARDHS